MLTPFGARTPGWMCYFLLEWFLNATVVQKRNYPLFQHLLFHSLSLSLWGDVYAVNESLGAVSNNNPKCQSGHLVF